MRKIYIDCGFHKGKKAVSFMKANPDFFCYGFEPNILMNNLNADNRLLLRDRLAYSNYTVYDSDGFLKLNIGRGDMQGSSVYDGKSNLSSSFSEVECIDLSKFIFNNFSKEDYIVLKIDIEGAEYVVLPHLIRTGAMDYIDELIVEFHSHKFKDGRFKAIHAELKPLLKNLSIQKTFWHF